MVMLVVNTSKNLVDGSVDLREDPLVVLFPDHPRDENYVCVEILPAMLRF